MWLYTTLRGEGDRQSKEAVPQAKHLQKPGLKLAQY